MAKDRMKLIGQEWKALSADEKSVRILQAKPRFDYLLTLPFLQKYEDLAKQDKARYTEEFKDTYGYDLPVKTPPRPRVAAVAA